VTRRPDADNDRFLASTRGLETPTEARAVS
jgi:hypothetical protein